MEDGQSVVKESLKKNSFAFVVEKQEKMVFNSIVKEIEKTDLATVFYGSIGTCMQKSGDGFFSFFFCNM